MPTAPGRNPARLKGRQSSEKWDLLQVALNQTIRIFQTGPLVPKQDFTEVLDMNFLKLTITLSFVYIVRT